MRDNGRRSRDKVFALNHFLRGREDHCNEATGSGRRLLPRLFSAALSSPVLSLQIYA